MTHREWIKKNFTILAETDNAVFFDTGREKIAEINGQPFDCQDLEHFVELVDFWGNESFEE